MKNNLKKKYLNAGMSVGSYVYGWIYATWGAPTMFIIAAIQGAVSSGLLAILYKFSNHFNIRF